MSKTAMLKSRPLYNIQKSYIDNLREGPQFFGPLPEKVHLPKSQWIKFLGYEAASPLGVPAGPLLNSRWTSLAAAFGFDIVTYKTIRSKAHSGHPLPNVIFVKKDPSNSGKAIATQEPEQTSAITITNSFGMPSMSPDYLQEDIAKARGQLSSGQILIVSVVGTPGLSQDTAEDFGRTAIMAKEAGAHVIEANFSCPNISSNEGMLYADPHNAFQIADKISRTIRPLPLLIKVGSYTCYQQLKEVLIALAKADVRGILGINSVSMRVIDEKQAPALGQGRETGGICGNLIRPNALEFVQEAARIIRKEKLDLELAGCGGIMQEDHVDQFLQAGAKVAMTATGMMWDPYIAHRWKQKQKNQSS